MKIRAHRAFPGKQQGAAAIEFAAVFVVFFAVFYGMVSYSLPLLM
ncbi:pilus assembly protein TadE, partial [Pseudomonas syringae pv. actinidifoliorum]|nr:pilus assembly protein TadE [Pseudomonas syringae pv. actinidifoliorum]